MGMGVGAVVVVEKGCAEVEGLDMGVDTVIVGENGCGVVVFLVEGISEVRVWRVLVVEGVVVKIVGVGVSGSDLGAGIAQGLRHGGDAIAFGIKPT